VPHEVVIRRYKIGIANLRHIYLPLADIAAIYDNSDAGRVLIAERTPGAPLVVRDVARWRMIERAAR
jgi:predicted ABC-type ATPase